MNAFNALFSAIFDVLLAPLGHARPWFDLLVWPTLAGIVALLVYKAVSNQAGIARAKNGIQVSLLEVLLYKDSLRVVGMATLRAVLQNILYLAHNIVPMLVMFVPMTAILVQIVAHYGYAPLRQGDTTVLVATLDPAVEGVSPRDVTIDLPDGISLDAPPVRTADGEIAYRLRLDTPGDHTVTLHAGASAETKVIAVGGAPRKVSPLRTKSWEALLYPAEPVPAATSPFYSLTVDRRDQDLGPFPAGEGGILLWFFGFSLVSGLLLKNRFGVTL